MLLNAFFLMHLNFLLNNASKTGISKSKRKESFEIKKVKKQCAFSSCCAIRPRRTQAVLLEAQNTLMGEYKNLKKVPKTVFSFVLFLTWEIIESLLQFCSALFFLFFVSLLFFFKQFRLLVCSSFLPSEIKGIQEGERAVFLLCRML